MSYKKFLTLLALFAFAFSALGQSKHEMDPEVKNYKLSMEKIKAFDGVVHKLMAAAAADPALKASMNDSGKQKTLADMVANVERNPKLMAAIKSGGLTAKEFCLIPMGVMAAGGAYMIQTQYKKDASSLATAENIAFYGQNKTEIDKISNSWAAPEEK